MKISVNQKENLSFPPSCTIRHISLVPWCVGLDRFHCICNFWKQKYIFVLNTIRKHLFIVNETRKTETGIKIFVKNFSSVLTVIWTYYIDTCVIYRFPSVFPSFIQWNKSFISLGDVTGSTSSQSRIIIECKTMKINFTFETCD